MASGAANSSRATVESRVAFLEYSNLAAGGAITPLALERFDLVAVRFELECAHWAFQQHPSVSSARSTLFVLSVS
jgi:hypothetical protein